VGRLAGAVAGRALRGIPLASDAGLRVRSLHAPAPRDLDGEDPPDRRGPRPLDRRSVWAPDSKSLFVGTEDEGTRAVWRVPAEGGPSTKLYNANFSGFQVSPDGAFLVGRLVSLRAPGEIARLSAGKPALTLLTQIGASWLHGKTLGEVESVWIDGAKGPAGAKGAQIQGWLVKPPGFEKGKKYPFLLMVHGGPQQAWLDAFGGSMWNPQIFAAHGYVVLALNPHGSTGFGQAFTNQISGDWGGAVHEDCMRACDWAVAEGFADPNRMGALGGSFGGYMVNWFLGHTDRFKALVSHAGVYNLESMWGVTEELWFPEWDLKGRPWDSAQYQDRSPHKFAKNFKTPTLVTHGELDYRVPIGEGIQLFQTLVRLGVPARFLYYPDEGHWLLKARNRELWLRTVLEWFDTYVKNAK
jgi:dipeptidyl aminopeptidase/acylaminoacyl peptidase